MAYPYSPITKDEIQERIKNGRFAFPGGYPMYFVTNDGAALCFGCAEENWDEVEWDIDNKTDTGWRVIGFDINYESAIYCDHCGNPIESAYGAFDDDGNEIEWPPEGTKGV